MGARPEGEGVIYLPILMSLLAVDLAAAMSPGPNFVLVSQSAVDGDRKTALAIVGGFALSNLLWCAAVMLGLAALFRVVPQIYAAIRIIGGLYLIFLGIQLWRKSDKAIVGNAANDPGSLVRALVRGTLTNLTNPKSAVYFASIFVLFIQPGMPAWLRWMAVAIVIADTLIWYGFVALVFSTPRVRRWYRRAARTVDRVAGTLMVAFGGRLAVGRI
jgi:threonine efflux protein